jgi:hypothetical protein
MRRKPFRGARAAVRPALTPPAAGRSESAARNERKVKEAHRRIMIANHPDSGGSDYIASKVNEAKDVMLGKKGGSDASSF